MTTFELILVILYICNGLACYIVEFPSMINKELHKTLDNKLLYFLLNLSNALWGLILIVPAWPTILIFKFVKEEF